MDIQICTYIEVFDCCFIGAHLSAFFNSIWVISGNAMVEHDVAESKYAGFVQYGVHLHIIVIAQFLE